MKTKLIFALTAVLVLAACAPKTAPTPVETLPPVQLATDTAASPSGQTVEVTVQGFTFDPIELTITAGTTVQWTNMDSAKHTISADDGSWGSGNLGQGATFSFTFDQPGTFAYHCEIHPTMAATIIVTAP